MIVSPEQPIRTLVPVASQIREASCVKASWCAWLTKRNETSGSAPCSEPRTSSITERMASEVLVARERLAANGMEFAISWGRNL
jgi:hypothetical protein